MVLQPPLVFPVSVRENIAYGRPEAGLEEVITAAKLARIHESIDRLPDKYETLVGEQGATLSEGERQRITIARAILRNSPILILDEPTSSVDAETEALIMEGLEQLTAGRTTFIIAHRLSTVRKADRIIVLRKGEIIEQGPFDELVNAHGPFRGPLPLSIRSGRAGIGPSGHGVGITCANPHCAGMPQTGNVANYLCRYIIETAAASRRKNMRH